MSIKKTNLRFALSIAFGAMSFGNLMADDDTYFDPNGPLTFDEAVSTIQSGWEEVYVSVGGVVVDQVDSDEYILSLGDIEILLDVRGELPLSVGQDVQITGVLETSDEYASAGILYELEAEQVYAADGSLISGSIRDDDDDDQDDDDDYDDDDDDSTGSGSGSVVSDPLPLNEGVAFLQAGLMEVSVSATGTVTSTIGTDDYVLAAADTEVVVSLWSGQTLSVGDNLTVVGILSNTVDYVAAGIIYELDAYSIYAADGTLLASDATAGGTSGGSSYGDDDDDDDDYEDDDDHLGGDDDDHLGGDDDFDDDDDNGNGSSSGSGSGSGATDIVALAEGIDFLQAGLMEVTVSAEGTVASAIGTDDFVLTTAEGDIAVSLWTGQVLTIGDAVVINGALKPTTDYASAGITYELDAYSIYAADGTLLASDSTAGGTSGGSSYGDDDDDDDDYEDDDDHLGGDDDDHLGGDDDSDDDDRDGGKNNSRNVYTFADAIARLEQGWEEAYISVQGTPIAILDDDDYLFEIDGIPVVLDSWEGALLTLGEPLEVTGELEYTDDYPGQDILYELDAMRLNDLAGNRLGEEGREDDDDSDDEYGKRTTGTLAELVALLETSGDDDLNVKTTGFLGQLIAGSHDDEDYLFSDGSGLTVVLDLNSRANVHFELAEGLLLEIIGELDRVDADDNAPEGIFYELDAVAIRLADGTTLDVGQATPFAESTISDWMGYFWKMDDEGWYYHPSKGFIYGGESLGDDDWFFSANIQDWVYSGRDLYPFIFSGNDGWNYLVGSSYGGIQHAYNYDKDEWIMDFWHQNPPAN